MAHVKNTLILTVGLPRSGKSTWAQKTGCPIVSPDSIRLALYNRPFLPAAEDMVWTIVKYMIRALFLAGHIFVILDATNTRKEQRDRFLPGHHGDLWDEVWLKVFTTSEQVCIQRAIKGNRQDLIPIIKQMYESYEQPDPAILKVVHGNFVAEVSLDGEYFTLAL